MVHIELQPPATTALDPATAAPATLSGYDAAVPDRHLAALDDAPGRLTRLTSAWLAVRRSARTRSAYRRDLQLWLVHCASTAADPLRARPAEIDAWTVAQRRNGAHGDRPAAETTIARRLAAVSAWYEYLLTNTADDPQPLVTRNPVARAVRPRHNPDYSPTIGLTAAEMDQLLAAADTDSATSGALIRLAFTEGLRVGSILTARVEDLGYDQGHRTLDVRVKGRPDGQPDRIPLPPVVTAAIDSMLTERGHPTEGPLFRTPTDRPIYHMWVYRLVRRLAKCAAIPAFEQMTPHALRATAITLYLDATGGDVRGAQRFAGHARPETTIGYDRRRRTYADHGAYVLARRFGDRTGT